MEQINIAEQLVKAAKAAKALGDAGISVVDVLLSKPTYIPFILVSPADAKDLILTDKVEMKPRIVEYQNTPEGLRIETYKCEFMDCVVLFSFVKRAGVGEQRQCRIH